MVRAGDAEPFEHGVAGNAIAKIHDVVHHGGMTRAFGIGKFSVGRGQRHGTHGFQANALMNPIEPDQRLPLMSRAVFTRVNLDDLHTTALRRCFQCVLNVFTRKHMVAVLSQRDAKSC